jgi:hypothetical protein
MNKTHGYNVLSLDMLNLITRENNVAYWQNKQSHTQKENVGLLRLLVTLFEREIHKVH